jgi:hypothetical protein
VVNTPDFRAKCHVTALKMLIHGLQDWRKLWILPRRALDTYRQKSLPRTKDGVVGRDTPHDEGCARAISACQTLHLASDRLRLRTERSPSTEGGLPARATPKRNAPVDSRRFFLAFNFLGRHGPCPGAWGGSGGLGTLSSLMPPNIVLEANQALMDNCR